MEPGSSFETSVLYIYLQDIIKPDDWDLSTDEEGGQGEASNGSLLKITQRYVHLLWWA